MSDLSISQPPKRKAAVEISASGAWRLARATWIEAGKDNLGLISSGVAFYIFLAFNVPSLIKLAAEEAETRRTDRD